jgi:hypothetical protein
MAASPHRFRARLWQRTNRKKKRRNLNAKLNSRRFFLHLAFFWAWLPQKRPADG